MASSERMTTFRLTTINVHSFDKRKKYRNNIDDLVSIFKPFSLDLIAVQEIQNNKKWERFCQLFSLPNFVYGSTEGEYFGNGIASRHPVRSHTNQRWKVLCQGGTRSLLQFCLDGDHPFVEDRIFAVAHLDPFNEDDAISTNRRV